MAGEGLVSSVPSARALWVPRPVTVAIGTLSALASVLLFGAAGRDDSFITFWEAEQLADHGRLVNVNGARIEQSSSLAHVVVLALLHLITRASFPLLAVLVGSVCLIATVCMADRAAEMLRHGAGLPTAVVCALAFPLMYWSTGGLETLLASVAVLWFVVALASVVRAGAHARGAWGSLLASAVLIETVRPDTMVVAACAAVSAEAAALFVRRRAREWTADVDVRNAGRAAVVVVGVGVALALVRELYFHSVLPQPDLSKAGGFGTILQGASYLVTALPWWVSLPLVVALVAGVVVCVRRRQLVGLVAGEVVALGALSILFTRGDWMGGARLLVPYLPLAIALAVVGARSLPVPARRASAVVVALGEIALVVAFVNGATWLSPTESGATTTSPYAIAADTGAPIWTSWQWSGGTLPALPWYMADDAVRDRDSEFLKVATPVLRDVVDATPDGAQVTIASDQAGLVMYSWANAFPGRLHFFDTANVVTSSLEHCPHLLDVLAGTYMTYGNWAHYAGMCAPPLPDVVFEVGTISSFPALESRYHVVVSVDVLVRRTGVGARVSGGGAEFLAIRDGWTPGQ